MSEATGPIDTSHLDPNLYIGHHLETSPGTFRVPIRSGPSTSTPSSSRSAWGLSSPCCSGWCPARPPSECRASCRTRWSGSSSSSTTRSTTRSTPTASWSLPGADHLLLGVPVQPHGPPSRGPRPVDRLADHRHSLYGPFPGVAHRPVDRPERHHRAGTFGLRSAVHLQFHVQGTQEVLRRSALPPFGKWMLPANVLFRIIETFPSPFPESAVVRQHVRRRTPVHPDGADDSAPGFARLGQPLGYRLPPS